MGFLDSIFGGRRTAARAESAAETAARAREALRRGDEAGALALLDQARPTLGASPAVVLAIAVRDEAAEGTAETLALARRIVEHALASSPDHRDALVLRAELDLREGRHEPAAAAYRRVLELDPDDDVAVANLADVLVASGRPDEALALLAPWVGEADDADPEARAALDEDAEEAPAHLRIAAARARLAAGRRGEALHELADLVHELDLRLEAPEDRAKAEGWQEDRALAEAVVEEEWRRVHGDLAVGRAGSGRRERRFAVRRMVGEILMVGAGSGVAPLASIDAARARARSLEGAAAHLARGECALREGDGPTAADHVRAAIDSDPEAHAGHLALASALELVESAGLEREVRAPSVPAEAASILPDLPALGELERAVALASLEPVRTVLPALAAAGVVVRVVPLGAAARAVDGVDPGDRRVRTVTCAVGPSRGAVPVEELLDVGSEVGWQLAHVLALLAHARLDASSRAEIASIHEASRALEREDAEEGGDSAADGAESVALAPEVAGDDAFFAALVVDWLRDRHRCGPHREPDDEGVYDSAMALVDRLAGA